MTTREFHILYEKLLSGIITTEEKAKLFCYIDKMDERNARWQDEMGDKKKIENEIYSLLVREIKRRLDLNKGLWTVAAAIMEVVLTTSAIYNPLTT